MTTTKEIRRRLGSIEDAYHSLELALKRVSLVVRRHERMLMDLIASVAADSPPPAEPESFEGGDDDDGTAAAQAAAQAAASEVFLRVLAEHKGEKNE